MDFKKSGIPGFSVSEPFESFIDVLIDPNLIDICGNHVIRGILHMEDKKYMLSVSKKEAATKVETVELSIVFEDDYFEGIHMLSSTIDSFMEALAAKGSAPIYQDSGIWWPKERISFYIYEDVPHTICWWGENITNERVKSIFSS